MADQQQPSEDNHAHSQAATAEASTNSGGDGGQFIAVCGNHNPAHLAETFSDIVEKTQDNSCTNWRIASS